MATTASTRIIFIDLDDTITNSTKIFDYLIYGKLLQDKTPPDNFVPGAL